MPLDPCIEQQVGRRRIFWTTQPLVCGEYFLCGAQCVIPGLEYVKKTDGITIRTDEWLNSLILNILNTRARTDLPCPSPAGVYGHWSESYRNDGGYIGSRLWNAAAKPHRLVADAVKSIEAAIKADMSKLVMLGLADEVIVEAKDRNHNSAMVVITVVTSQKRHVLNLSGSFAAGEWIWQ